MKRTWAIVAAAAVLISLAGFAGTQPAPPKFFTGAKPTPPDKTIQLVKSGKLGIHKATAAPSQVVVVPKRLSYWGNNQYGVCVSSESAFSIVDFSKFLNLEEIFVTDAAVIDFARRHGWLNGAWLPEVIEAMQSEGIKDEKGVVRKAGKMNVVNYSDEESLKSAIAIGPVSIAIDAGALPSGAGNNSGWYSFGNKNRPNTNHCVSLHGYGPCSELFKALNVAMPSNAPANGYLLFTWSTIGVVDHAWLMGTCVEAYVRDPTVKDLAPTPPVPSTITVAVPSVLGGVGVSVKFSPIASGGTSPYLFLFDYGDGVQDAGGTHAYKTAGVFNVKVTAVDSKGGLGTGTCSATIGVTPPDPPVPPTPGGSGTITWTINGVTSSYELFPIGSRKQILDIIGPMSP